MREDFLHFLWRTKRLNLENLYSTENAPLQVLDFGIYNRHAGPDFIGAKVKIGGTLWAGNVEMHLRASDWIKHRHQEDANYDNVILHVVLEEDQPIFRKNGERIPCLQIAKRIPSNIQKTYQKIVHSQNWIPCQNQLHSVPNLTINLYLDRLLIERLEEKTTYIAKVLNDNKNAWETTFYQLLARNFGLKINAEPFELLARTIPHRLFAKHKNSLFQIEALLFGQAGMLQSDFKEAYPITLKKEYAFLQKKYDLHPIKEESWRFFRLRPANFPTIRIAQFATLIFQSIHLFSLILEVDTVKQIEQLFNVEPSFYWETHYVFDKPAIEKSKVLGKNTIHLFIINTIVPFLFLYGKYHSIESFKEKALRLLEQLPPEKNSIITRWRQLEVPSESAYRTQGLLQLKNSYCEQKRCLECAIGNSILK